MDSVTNGDLGLAGHRCGGCLAFLFEEHFVQFALTKDAAELFECKEWNQYDERDNCQKQEALKIASNDCGKTRGEGLAVELSDDDFFQDVEADQYCRAQKRFEQDGIHKRFFPDRLRYVQTFYDQQKLCQDQCFHEGKAEPVAEIRTCGSQNQCFVNLQGYEQGPEVDKQNGETLALLDSFSL